MATNKRNGSGEEASIVSLKDKDIAASESQRETAPTATSELDFGKIVDLLEEVFVGRDFQTRHSEYFTKHCATFSSKNDPLLGPLESDKLAKERFNIFRTYSVETAAFLEKELKRSLGNNFEIDQFLREFEKMAQLEESSTQKEIETSTGGSEKDCPTLPQPSETAISGTKQLFPHLQIDSPSTMANTISGEMFEVLVTLIDYSRFHELMVDFLEIAQGSTPDVEGLVTVRHFSDEDGTAA